MTAGPLADAVNVGRAAVSLRSVGVAARLPISVENRRPSVPAG
jgi:hypothetical protein